MPKLSNFKKALRLSEKASKHFFRNSALNHRPETIEGYQVENVHDVIKREHTYGHRNTVSKFPKGQIK